MLRAQGFDTVLITGTVTNVCCESSARDAMMLNFKTIFVSDANAAMTDEEHKCYARQHVLDVRRCDGHRLSGKLPAQEDRNQRGGGIVHIWL